MEAWEGGGRWGNVCGEGGGLNIFFSGPKFPPSIPFGTLGLHFIILFSFRRGTESEPVQACERARVKISRMLGNTTRQET